MCYESVQSLDGNTKKKKSCQKLIEILHKGQPCTPLMQSVHLLYTVGITPLYNGTNSIHMHTLCVHIRCINHVSIGLVHNTMEGEKNKFFIKHH